MALHDEQLTVVLSPGARLAARLDQGTLMPQVHVMSCHLSGVVVAFELAIISERVGGHDIHAAAAFDL